MDYNEWSAIWELLWVVVCLCRFSCVRDIISYSSSACFERIVFTSSEPQSASNSWTELMLDFISICKQKVQIWSCQLSVKTFIYFWGCIFGGFACHWICHWLPASLWFIFMTTGALTIKFTLHCNEDDSCLHNLFVLKTKSTFTKFIEVIFPQTLLCLSAALCIVAKWCPIGL